jgi:hypothetical protein
VWFNIDTNSYGPPGPKELGSIFGPGGSETIINSSQSLPGLSQNLIVFSEAFYGDSNHDTPTDPALISPPSGPGVYVNGQIPSGNGMLTTGIYVAGNVDLSSSSVPASDGALDQGSETFTFSPVEGEQPPETISGTVTVTVNFASPQTTTVVENGSTSVFSGVPSGEPNSSNDGNGAIFINGNANVADGSTVHGQYIIATPDPPLSNATPQDITLLGNLTYATEPSQNTPSEDELAIWANDIWLNTGENTPRVDGMILTGYAGECDTGPCADGFFANANCRAKTCTGGTGDAMFFGSLIQNISGKMGAVSGGEQLVGGFLRQDVYDPRLGSDPPPFSPTTDNYSIVALQNHDLF